MDASQPGKGSVRGSRRSALISVAIHAIVLIGLLSVLHGRARLAPYRMPGTRDGMQLLTYYAPGSTHPAVSTLEAKVIEKQKPTPTTRPLVQTLKLESAATLDSRLGETSSGQSGLGDGNITIAMQKYFPYPQPSLSSLPHGAAGDVILKAVIDEHGKIAQLTLLAGLGPAIDNDVIQTVNQWVYTPAMKDGVPVASVEELHFHYERRG
jgi:protein TonB